MSFVLRAFEHQCKTESRKVVEKIIVVAGMIGSGKSSIARILGEEFNSKVFYEPVEDNPFLEKFYTADDEEQEQKRYPFLLQLYFLNMRFDLIKQAYVHKHNVLDRSIYEDWYFAKVNNELGRISDEEFWIYEQLLDNMMDELKHLPKKSPDILVYLHGSFETILHQISKRGRDFEQDDNLIDYYYKLWSGYDDWVDNHYSASQVIKFNMDNLDFVNNEEDAQLVISEVRRKLEE